MFGTGFTVFLAMMLLLVKLPRRLALRLLHHDLVLDVGVSLLVLAIHFGTFSGVMAATVCGLLMSIFTSAAKRAFGHIQGSKYVPGYFNLIV